MIRATVLSILIASPAHGEDAARLQKLLYEAAASGNHAKFSAALARAKTAIDTMRLGAARNRLRRAIIVSDDLDRVWGVDAFYWDEDSLPDFYDRMSGEYPEFEKFITGHRLIDAHGHAFYPVRETRMFLIERLRPAKYRKR